MESIGNRITLLRERAELSQVNLSNMVGVTKSTMSKYEHDVTLPNAEMLDKIARVLETSADYIVGRTNDAAPHDKGNKWALLTTREQDLLYRYRLLSDRNRIRAFERVDAILEAQKLKKLQGPTRL